MKEIYIVVSQTGSIVSKILKKITGARYNHVSVSLSEDLDIMYSFARKYTYIPFWGAFVKEGAGFGAFKRFKDTEVVVTRLRVPSDSYNCIKEALEEMYKHKESYHYNYLGLFMAGFGKSVRQERCYYCSEFIRELLIQFDIADKNKFEVITQPIHFIFLPMCDVIYQGKLINYSSAVKA